MFALCNATMQTPHTAPIEDLFVFSLQEKMLAVDLLYKKEVFLVPKLNTHLEQQPFGPYDHLSHAVNELLNLRKYQPQRAKQLELALSSFATAVGSSLESLMQWPKLMQMKRERDAFSHPFCSSAPEKELKSVLDNNNPDLDSVAGALLLLLKAK